MGDVLAYEAELLGLVREVGALFCSSLLLKRAGSEALKRRSAIRPRVRCSHQRGGQLWRSERQRCPSGAPVVLPRVPAACARVSGLAAGLHKQLLWRGGQERLRRSALCALCVGAAYFLPNDSTEQQNNLKPKSFLALSMQT